MSENKYRSYLEDDTFHRQYLKNEEEPAGSSFFGKAITTGAIAVGTAAAAYQAFKKGHLQKPIEELITKLGQFRRTNLHGTLRGIRNWSKGKIWEDMNEMSLSNRLKTLAGHATSLKGYVDESLEAHRKRRASLIGSPITDDIPEFVRTLQQYNSIRQHGANERKKMVRGSAEYKQSQEKTRMTMRLMEKELSRQFNTTLDQQAAMVKRTGFRQATVEDIFPYLDDDAKRVIEKAKEMHSNGDFTVDPMKKIIDSNIFIKGTAKEGEIKPTDISDIRDVKDSMSDFMNTLAEDLTIPFIKINPIRMFYLNEFTRNADKPMFTVLRGNTRQPSITGDNQFLGQDYLYVNGTVYDTNKINPKTNTFEEVAKNGYLLDATGANSPITRLQRNMADITISDFKEPSKGTLRYYWNKFIAKPLDIGYQDEPIRNRSDIGDPALPIVGAVDALWNGKGPWSGLRPFESVSRERLDQAFGHDPDWLFMRSYKPLKETESISEYFGQFLASRKNMDKVTTASFFPYALFERLNATLNQVNLGLSTQNLGSAQQIFGNLVARRVAPVWLGIEGYKYANYTFEQMFGDEFEDNFMEFYKGASIEGAGLRDALGVTDAFKELGQMMPGHEFLTELPVPIMTTEGLTPVAIGDLFNMSRTEEEQREWFESGEEGIRKGRYWEFGNTPFTGAKVDYYQPNFYRRVTSDWEYTDTLWGSKEEYWANHALPTLQHPLAPLQHFVLDPYHWERKHYEDRPYMRTGGIPEIENFPLLGPLLNSTVGQILKPTQDMHTDEWKYTGGYQESEGFQLAEEYGILGSESSGQLTLASGYGGSGGYSGDVQAVDPVAYVTSSGSVSVMNKTGDINIGMINRAIKDMGVAKTGQADTIRFEDGQEITIDQGNPIEHTALLDTHYNLTELGGFYGWVSTMPTNMVENQYDPRIQTSIKAFGYERAFWDQDLGNLGFDANEIFRRFLPRDAHKNYVNPIDNNMPTWMPGEEYFTNFQQGDPYVKVKKGEMRLPGESYEVLYDIDSEKLDRLDVGASTIGYDKQKIVESWLHTDNEELAFEQFYTDRGTDWHKTWEAEMRSKGITISDEEYVKDEASGIGGFYDVLARHDKGLEWMLENAAEFTYYEASIPGTGNSQEGYYNKVDVSSMSQIKQQEMYQYLLSRSDTALIDPKTRTEKNWKEQEMKFANAQQVNFYAGQMDTPINYLVHVNMDAKEGEKALKVFAFEYNPFLEDYSKQKVEEARTEVRKMLADGAIGRGDLYDPVDKYRILADVAPYSQQFRQLKSQLSFYDLSEEEKKEIQEINSQLSTRKERVRTYDYRFTTADTVTKRVTVSKVLDNNTFLTEQYPDNPIKLAGVYVPTGENDPVAKEAKSLINNTIRSGATISIEINADETNQVNNDTYGTISANVVGMGVGSLNRALIARGLAKEDTDDYSPAAVQARFTDSQIAFGAIWEKFAHMDTPYHTKLLQVRSPLEQYERREIYGKDWQDWAEPIQDYAIPWYQNIISHQPGWAIALGTFMGAMFGEGPYGRTIGAMFGAVTTTLGLGYVGAFEALEGKQWIPERRRKEWEINEYVDALKYVKYRSLYEEYADLAWERERFDVHSYLKTQDEKGQYRQQRLRDLEQVKRDLKTAATPSDEADARRRATGILGRGEYPDLMKAINQEIEEIRNERRVDRISPIAAQAIQYYQASEKTMYGYDPGEPLANVLAALPKKDRQYLSKFIEAPEEEREQILQVVPGYMSRVLKSVWGMPVEEKPELSSYFTNHQLPDANWAGWDPRANLEDIKIKLVKKQGLDESEFDIWPDDEKRAEQIRDDIVPNIDFSERIGTVQRRLRDILGEAGLRDVQVEVTRSGASGINVDMNLQKDRRADIVRGLNENNYSLL